MIIIRNDGLLPISVFLPDKNKSVKIFLGEEIFFKENECFIKFLFRSGGDLILEKENKDIIVICNECNALLLSVLFFMFSIYIYLYINKFFSLPSFFLVSICLFVFSSFFTNFFTKCKTYLCLSVERQKIMNRLNIKNRNYSLSILYFVSILYLICFLFLGKIGAIAYGFSGVCVFCFFAIMIMSYFFRKKDGRFYLFHIYEYMLLLTAIFGYFNLE